MPVLYIYRVYRTKASCVWSGDIVLSGEPIPAPVIHLLRDWVIAPKHLAQTLAKLFQPLGDAASKIIEAYPASYSHAAVPEHGIGFALGKEKWTKFWPQFQWTVLHEVDEKGWKVVRKEWSIKQLSTQRRKKGKTPCGVDKRIWGRLGALWKKRLLE